MMLALRNIRVPSPLTLLVGCTLIAAALTYVIPAGEYDRRSDPATGRSVVVSGTFHRVPAEPVNVFGAAVAIPRGMIDAAAVVFFVFLVGGAFGVVDKTGALHDGIDWLVRRLGNFGILAIPLVSLAFAAGGALENMQEEIIALIPALLVLTQRLGFNAMTAIMMSVGAAAVGSAFSPINPFQVLIAQKVAHLPQGSGGLFRLVTLALALALWIGGTIRYAQRTRTPVDPKAAGPAAARTSNGRGGLVIAIVLVTFVVFVWGVMTQGWDFDQEAGLFFVMGVIAGVVGGLGIAGTADAFVDGFRAITLAAILIGVARSISVVMTEGHIIDTVVHALAAPLATLPAGASAIAMMVVQGIVHVPVPSVSGDAVLTLPVLVPVSDLIGLSRQVTVLAYQFGAGLCELVTPTNGGLMAILAAASVRFEDYIRVIARMTLVVVAFGAVSILVAIAIHLQ
jgi:uncharacterized ion transporter superfamily protein YfcC